MLANEARKRHIYIVAMTFIVTKRPFVDSNGTRKGYTLLPSEMGV